MRPLGCREAVVFLWAFSAAPAFAEDASTPKIVVEDIVVYGARPIAGDGLPSIPGPLPPSLPTGGISATPFLHCDPAISTCTRLNAFF